MLQKTYINQIFVYEYNQSDDNEYEFPWNNFKSPVFYNINPWVLDIKASKLTRNVRKRSLNVKTKSSI